MAKDILDKLRKEKYFVGGYEVSSFTKLAEHREQEKNSWGNKQKEDDDAPNGN